VQAVLAARIDALPPSHKHLLQEAAVIGHEVPFGLLHAICGLSEDQLLLIGFGLKLTFFSAPPAEAVAPPVETVRMDISQMHQNIKNLSEQRIHDMTFVFSEGD
jgi:hypothetical protein